MVTTVFTCYRCKVEKTHTSEISTGYGRDDNDNKICFECCAEQDKSYMREHGKITLYLNYEIEIGYQGSRRYLNKRVSNWPGTLKLPVSHMTRGRHNIAHTRYDVWFMFEGKEWHGVQYGDNTQVVHCKRVKRAK